MQFHPESVLTEGGHRLLATWLVTCGDPDAPARAEGLAPVVAGRLTSRTGSGRRGHRVRSAVGVAVGVGVAAVGSGGAIGHREGRPSSRAAGLLRARGLRITVPGSSSADLLLARLSDA